VIDPGMEDGVRITVIATGFGSPEARHEAEARSARAHPAGTAYRRSPAGTRYPGRGSAGGESEPTLPPNPALLRERWERAHVHDRLEVPAFIRKQMD
jgi:hypothetical protein